MFNTHYSAHAAENVSNIVVSVETYQIGSQQTVQYFFAPGQESEQLELGPRYMQKKADFKIWEFLPKKLRK